MNEKPSRQVRRQLERMSKKNPLPVTHRWVYVEFKRKSQSGVEHTFYKLIKDKING